MLLQLSHYFSLFYSPMFYIPPLASIPPPQFMSMSCTYKLFGFYISHTILNLPLSILYLPFMLLIPCTFSPILHPFPSLLITLPVITLSVNLFLFCLLSSFLVFCFCFYFQIWLFIVVFVVILLFIFLIFPFLDKSL